MAKRRVAFSAVVVFDGDALIGVEMDCLTCGEIGYKGAQAIVEHARTHPDPVEYVMISRSLMDELERQAGLDPDGVGQSPDVDSSS